MTFNKVNIFTNKFLYGILGSYINLNIGKFCCELEFMDKMNLYVSEVSS